MGSFLPDRSGSVPSLPRTCSLKKANVVKFQPKNDESLVDRLRKRVFRTPVSQTMFSPSIPEGRIEKKGEFEFWNTHWLADD